jgi:hypothetical protein
MGGNTNGLSIAITSPLPYLPERSPGSPGIPVIVIVIAHELELDEVELVEATAPIAGGLSPLAGSADPGEEPPPRNKKIARTEARHNHRSIFIIARLLPPNMLNRNILAQHILYNLPHAAKCGRISCPTGETPSKTTCNPERLGSKVAGIRP